MQDHHSKAAAQPAESLIQNFFIVLPSAGQVAEMTGSPQVSNILGAIQTALGSGNGQPQKPVLSPITFAEVAQEWFCNSEARWAVSYRGRLKNRLETYLLEHLGSRPISAISPPEILEVIRKIELRDVRETARRILRIASAVFRYAVATGRCAQDPTTALRGALRPPRAVKHRAMLTAKDLPKFLQLLTSYQGDLTKYAMELVLLTFVRTAELRFAKWHEFEGLSGQVQSGEFLPTA